MDFTLFVKREAIPALTWLGHRDWLDFGISPNFEQRTVWTRPKPFNVSPDERKKFGRDFWEQVEHIVGNANKDVVNSFLALALSKAIAGGPKVFQPTFEDCEALENTACNISFDDYKQPYPVVIIEFPSAYRARLAKMWSLPKGPSHVIVHHDSEKRFITVSVFFDRNNVICHIMPSRTEYQTIEDAIVRNNDMPDVIDAADDFKVAELAQRLAVNFCMVMVLMGVRQIGPLDPVEYAKAKKLSGKKDQRKSALGKKLLASTMYKIDFISQRIKLYEEEWTDSHSSSEEEEQRASPKEEEQMASPKPHWRRGHYRQQPCGPHHSERKIIFIKPVLVRASFFTGPTQNTEVVYRICGRRRKVWSQNE